MNRNELEGLIGRYMEGICSQHEAEQLLAELGASEEARRLLARHLYHEATIARLLASVPEEASEAGMPEAARVRPPSRRKKAMAGSSRRRVGLKKRAFPLVPLVAAAAVLIFVGYASRMSTRRAQPPEPKIATAPRAEKGIARLSEVEGLAEYARAGGGTWLAARKGLDLFEGDRLRAGAGRARVGFTSGSVMYVRGGSELALASGEAAPSVSLSAGEIYVETVHGDRGFFVETPHGRAVDLGTRFGVETEIGKGTTVAVAEGKVEASTDAGKAEVKRGQEVLLARLTGPPGEVRQARDLEKRLAWATGAKPAPVSPRADRDKGLAYRVVDDFESGNVNGWVAAWDIGPNASGSRAWFSFVAPGHESGHALRVQYDVKDTGSSWAGVLTRPEPRRAQDWSGYEGVELWFHGDGTGCPVIFELFDNGRPGESGDTWERFICTIRDDVRGWRRVYMPWSAFTRFHWQPPGAPDDGLTLTIRALAIIVNENRKGWFMVDGIRLLAEPEREP